MKTRKELKQEYKQMTFQMGIFTLRNVNNNKIFVDSSLDIKSKLNRHKIELKFGNHRNRTLQQEWNEQGENNFIFEVLHELKEKKEEHVNYMKELDILQSLAIEELTKENTTFY